MTGGRGLFVYAGALADGLSVYALEPGVRFELAQTLPVAGPSHLATSAEHGKLYAVTHTATFEGLPGSGLVAFDWDQAGGGLAPRSRCLLPATNAAYVALDRTGRLALVAYTLGGAAGVVRLHPDGAVDGPTDLRAHAGAALVPVGSLEGPRIPPLPPGYCVPHAAEATPDNRTVLVPDLGLDRLFLYRLDAAAGRLTTGPVPWLAFPAGSGPRHLCFHPAGRFVYVLTELASTVVVVALPEADGEAPRIVATVAALPARAGQSAAADIHLHPSARFLYTSNRGHDSISVLAVAPEGDRLELIATTPCGGRHPRSFALSETGETMVVSNRDSGNLVEFAVDPGSGRVEPTGIVATGIERPAGVLLRTPRRGGKGDPAHAAN